MFENEHRGPVMSIRLGFVCMIFLSLLPMTAIIAAEGVLEMEIGSTEVIILNDLVHSTLKTMQMLRIDTLCSMKFHNLMKVEKMNRE